MIAITETQILKLAPKAIPEYLKTFRNGEEVLTRYGINANARRVAHFMSQVLHECGALRIKEENMNYSFEGLTETFGKHRISHERAREICRTQGRAADQEAIANTVYGGAWGKKNLGNTDPGDGWRYRGRGLIQITGRAMYKELSKVLGVDLVAEPKLVFDPRFALEIAAAYWKRRGCNELADKAKTARSVTKAINGGDIGLPEREKWLEKTSKVWS